MATSSNVEIREYDAMSVCKLSVASGTVLAKGDFIKYSAGNAVAVTAADNTTFAGIALEGSESGSVAPIAVATRAQFYIKVASTSTAAAFGNAFRYSAGANGTDWEVTKCTSGVSGITWALETVAAGSRGLFYIDVGSLKSGFLFEAIS